MTGKGTQTCYMYIIYIYIYIYIYTYIHTCHNGTIYIYIYIIAPAYQHSLSLSFFLGYKGNARRGGKECRMSWNVNIFTYNWKLSSLSIHYLYKYGRNQMKNNAEYQDN